MDNEFYGDLVFLYSLFVVCIFGHNELTVTVNTALFRIFGFKIVLFSAMQ